MKKQNTYIPQDWNYFIDEHGFFAWAINCNNGTVIRVCKMKSEASIQIVPNNFQRTQMVLANCLEHKKPCTDADFVKLIGNAAKAIDNTPFVSKQ